MFWSWCPSPQAYVPLYLKKQSHGEPLFKQRGAGQSVLDPIQDTPPILVNEDKMQKRKILIIDDEAAFTRSVKLTLEMKNGYEICAENNPCMAITTARQFDPDIILLDVIMPELDGGEVYNQLKADTLLRHIPIIFLTAIVRQEDVDSNNGMIGGRSYIAKPVNAEELIKAIEETAGKAHKRKPQRKVKKEVVAYLEKFSQGRAIEIANLTGLKVSSVEHALNQLRKSGLVLRDKKHGSPFVLAKK